MSTRANDVAHHIAEFLDKREGWPQLHTMTHEPNLASDRPGRDGTFTLWLASEFTGIKVTVEDVPLEDIGTAAGDQQDVRA